MDGGRDDERNGMKIMMKNVKTNNNVEQRTEQLKILILDCHPL